MTEGNPGKKWSTSKKVEQNRRDSGEDSALESYETRGAIQSRRPTPSFSGGWGRAREQGAKLFEEELRRRGRSLFSTTRAGGGGNDVDGCILTGGGRSVNHASKRKKQRLRKVCSEEKRKFLSGWRCLSRNKPFKSRPARFSQRGSEKSKRYFRSGAKVSLLRTSLRLKKEDEGKKHRSRLKGRQRGAKRLGYVVFEKIYGMPG